MEGLLMVTNEYEDKQSVSARELHKSLGIEKRFSSWFETNSKGFIEGEDFTSVLSGTVVNNGATKPLQDYSLSIDMAKHICLMSRTEKGKQVRQYLIDLEKAWNTPEQIFARALKLADRTIENLQLTIKEQQPLVDFANQVSESADTVDMGEMAKLANSEGISIGRNRLIQWLKDNKILNKDRVPYQQYIDRGYFNVAEVTKDTVYGARIFLKTTVTGKGQIWLIERLRKEYK